MCILSFTWLQTWAVYYFSGRYLRNGKHFPCFHCYSLRNTSGSLGEREIEVGTRTRRASVSTQFRVLPNFHECFYNVWEHGENVFYFFYKITRRKLKRGNSLLYRSVNYPYCSWYRMRWRESFHVFDTVIETLLLTNQSSRFQNVIL